MKTRASAKKYSSTSKSTRHPVKRNFVSSNQKKELSDKKERAKLIDPAAQTTKKSDEVYAIDSIEGFMTFNSNPYYLVHWKGYDLDEDMTWEPEKDIHNCDFLISKFWTKRLSILSSKESKDKNDSNKTSNLDSENKSDPSDNEGYGFEIIKTQQEEIIRLKKERKEYLKQIKYLNSLREISIPESDEKSKSIPISDVDVSKDDDSDVCIHSDDDYESEGFDINNDDNYNKEIKPKLESGYVPDYIIKSRCQNSKQQYLVKWSGFSNDDATWIDEKMIDDYYVKIYRLVYCSPMIRQLRIVFMNEKKLVHQYNVLFSNGQLLWLSEGQINKRLLNEFQAKNCLNKCYE